MRNNSFIAKSLMNVAKQIGNFYKDKFVLDKVSAITIHQDDGCSCVEVELDGLNRKDRWQWLPVKSENGEGLHKNGWILKDTEPIEAEEQVAESVESDTTEN